MQTAFSIEPRHLRETTMTQLEDNLNRVLEEHQHESGLHIIGGRRRLIDRLVELFEGLKQEGGQRRLANEPDN
jgi:hypothetical protein